MAACSSSAPSESKSTAARGPADPTLVLPESPRRASSWRRTWRSQRITPATTSGSVPGPADEVARNLSWHRFGTRRPTSTPCPLDALDLASLDAAARRRANQWVVIVSALHGAVRLKDRITAYRLSMDVNLPGLGPVVAAWRPVLDDVLAPAAGREVVVDCRSSTYAAAWTPVGEVADRWVQVRVPGASHMAKHTRGLVARHLCVRGVRASTPEKLAALVAEHSTWPSRPRCVVASLGPRRPNTSG